ncbi:MAG: DUF4293 domain-containing protein [Dysgonomonas sp.]
MIQRIQTVFLLLTAILMGVVICCPIFEIIDFSKFAIVYHTFDVGHMLNSKYPAWGLLPIAILSFILPLVNIFFYKKRKLQINLGLITALLIVIYYVVTIVYINAYLYEIETAKMDFKLNLQFGIILPVIALVFNLLAIYRIRKDEKLVKSLDRIR